MYLNGEEIILIRVTFTYDNRGKMWEKVKALPVPQWRIK